MQMPPLIMDINFSDVNAKQRYKVRGSVQLQTDERSALCCYVPGLTV